MNNLSVQQKELQLQTPANPLDLSSYKLLSLTSLTSPSNGSLAFASAPLPALSTLFTVHRRRHSLPSERTARTERLDGCRSAFASMTGTSASGVTGIAGMAGCRRCRTSCARRRGGCSLPLRRSVARCRCRGRAAARSTRSLLQETSLDTLDAVQSRRHQLLLACFLCFLFGSLSY